MTKRRRQAIPSAADMPALRDSLADQMAMFYRAQHDVDPDGKDDHWQRGAQIITDAVDALRDPALWWVSKPMTLFAREAAASMIEWTPSLCRPARSGVLVWGGRLVAGRDRGLLLRSATSRRLTPPEVYRVLDQLSEITELGFNVRPHMLRATFVTLSLDAGVPARDVMASTGHAHTAMVDYYDRQHAAIRRNASHRLADWLDSDT